MSTFLGALATGFARRGCETAVIAMRAAGRSTDGASKESGRRARMAYRYLGIPGWNLLSVFLSGLRVILRDRPSFVLVGHWYPHAFVAPIWRMLTGTPYFIVVHGNELFPYHPNLLRRTGKRLVMKSLLCFLLKADGLLANSGYTAGLLQSMIGVPSERVAVLHPPVMPEFFGPVSKEEQLRIRRKHGLVGKRVILTVGHLEERKGASRVLEALPRILEAEPRAHYLVVGGGPRRRLLERMVDSLGIRHAVSFANEVPHDRLPAYHALADLYVMVSYGVPEKTDVETFGIVYLEAAAAGKPVIAGTQGGVSDAVLGGETGLMVDAQDKDAIIGAITRLLADPEMARRMGAAGRERARAYFTPEAIAGQALDAIAGSGSVPCH